MQHWQLLMPNQATRLEISLEFILTWLQTVEFPALIDMVRIFCIIIYEKDLHKS